MIAIDTLSYARRLEKAGVPREQAEAHAEAVHDLVREEVATKADVEAVRADVEAVRRDLKRDIQEAEARLRAEIREVDLRLGAKVDQVEAKLDAKIDQVAARLEARIDGVENRMGQQENRIVIKVGGMLAAAVALTAAFVKLL